MALNINVEFQELAEASTELSQISSEMKTIMGRMSSIIEEMGREWPDENGKEFVKKFEDNIQSKFKDYYGSVQSYSDFIKGAHDKYVAHVEATGRLIKEA